MVSTEDICGNWQTFNYQKCFKVINEEKLMTYEEAVELCSKAANGSTLITIHSNEEQEFIVKYVFETRKIVDSVWLGLKNSSNSFEWIDKTFVEFGNWANGSPGNKSDHKCVEIMSDSSPIGKWADIQCTKRNIAICQRSPVLTVEYLMKKLSETKDLLTKTTAQLNAMTSKMNSVKVLIH